MCGGLATKYRFCFFDCNPGSESYLDSSTEVSQVLLLHSTIFEILAAAFPVTGCKAVFSKAVVHVLITPWGHRLKGKLVWTTLTLNGTAGWDRPPYRSCFGSAMTQSLFGH